MRFVASVILAVSLSIGSVLAQTPEISPEVSSLFNLWNGKTKQVNALWHENDPRLQFGDGRNKVVIANLKGPGMITMIHFALPQTMKLNRDTVLRIYWDDEKNPSVEAPLVDFFCDPNGALERVENVLINKKRGWNCYFPMPFAKSARIELEYQNPRYPCGPGYMNPCYSYVMYRPLKKLPKNAGLFHACWRQETLLLGKREYEALSAKGKGQFIGWNCTIRGAGSPTAGYPVDENVNFYVDGEREPSIVWQGLEDAFGFSWGFPEHANGFQYTGYQPYLGNGAAAYRFTLNDRITFQKSLRVTIGFGKIEHMFIDLFSKPENALQISSVVYWYQTEPHAPFAPIPGPRERMPVFTEPAAKSAPATGESLILTCGRTEGDDEYLAGGWDFRLKRGYGYCGWPTEVNHCWADYKSLEFDILCPKGVEGVLKLYILDADNFWGGRKQSIKVANRLIGEYENFQSGKWVEVEVSRKDTAQGWIPIVIKNLKPGANAVVSLVKFLRKG
jgi:hypothetical protein